MQKLLAYGISATIVTRNENKGKHLHGSVVVDT